MCFTGHTSKRDSADNRTLSRSHALNVGNRAFVCGGDESKAGCWGHQPHCEPASLAPLRWSKLERAFPPG